MLQRRQATPRSDSGFTLIELLIVIAILGILAAIVVFSIVGVTDRGKKAACQADLNTATTAVEAYFAKNNVYPPDLDTLTTGENKFLNPPAPKDVAYTVGTPATSYTIGYASDSGC
ncbi:type II secretion system protein [Amycolatopsis alkalitolerans]|uniref:Type II secretion system protein n=1 Tax=Amycolatopsis alkalitolerans TaxID=2547244 RepID=A0A5C4MAE5_9PSEU|nr:type II secretion system protein [Amycolatopsis alkalitolerans]TNC29579.1 type II secretion system protein [Amycolatopsis alkalitolerans]